MILEQLFARRRIAMNLRFMGRLEPLGRRRVALAMALLAWFLYRRETRPT
jgi:hypothetical protein